MRSTYKHILATALAAVVILAINTSRMAAQDQSAAPAQDQAALPAQETAAPPPDPVAIKAAQIERGRYLANDVALCVVCHSPKDQAGNPIREQAFHGGVIPARATYNGMKPWASNAPALGPMAGGAPDDVAYLLQTGIWRPTGQSPKAPMPPFRLSEEDANAVVAYLRSLQSIPPQ
jgi:mono/diheme cytochrome c family protein